MIELALMIGDCRGMDAAVSALLQSSRRAVFHRSLPDSFDADALQARLVLVCQQYPDEYGPSQIEMILSRFPIARIVVCQGAWCVSYGRSRGHWPAALCVPVDEAADRIAREAEVIRGERAPLPWTAGLDEIFAFQHAPVEKSS